jgi:hypothetical protein
LQIALLTFGCTCGLLRRQSRGLAKSYFVVAATALVLFIAFRIHFEGKQLSAQSHFDLYRGTHFLSGSSPPFPLLFLLLMVGLAGPSRRNSSRQEGTHPAQHL